MSFAWPIFEGTFTKQKARQNRRNEAFIKLAPSFRAQKATLFVPLFVAIILTACSQASNGVQTSFVLTLIEEMSLALKTTSSGEAISIVDRLSASNEERIKIYGHQKRQVKAKRQRSYDRSHASWEKLI